jgi:hypothetical protein
MKIILQISLKLPLFRKSVEISEFLYLFFLLLENSIFNNTTKKEFFTSISISLLMLIWVWNCKLSDGEMFDKINFFCPREKVQIYFLLDRESLWECETQNNFFGFNNAMNFPFSRRWGWRERRRLNENVCKNRVYIQRYLRKAIASLSLSHVLSAIVSNTAWFIMRYKVFGMIAVTCSIEYFMISSLEKGLYVIALKRTFFICMHVPMINFAISWEFTRLIFETNNPMNF